ncbi:MAG TPA: thioredoxin [Clostridiaceae bacterium]|nr:thioredoxin [Clostridiaceae bacterium]
MPKTITKANFTEEVINSEIPFLVDFWAPWCAPCRLVGPSVEKLKEHYKGKLEIGKVNVDDEAELAERYRVMNIPTLYLFKDGEIVDKMVGARPFEDLVRTVDKHI